MAIRWEKLTVKAQEAIQRANEVASEHGNPELQPVHVLAALAQDAEGIVVPVLEKIGVNPKTIAAEAGSAIERLPRLGGEGSSQAHLSDVTSKVLDRAFKEASDFKD